MSIGSKMENLIFNFAMGLDGSLIFYIEELVKWTKADQQLTTYELQLSRCNKNGLHVWNFWRTHFVVRYSIFCLI